MGLKFDEFEIGAKYISQRRTVRMSDIQQFTQLSGDFNPLHTDEFYIKENTPFRECIAQGAFTFALSTGFSFQDRLTAGTIIAFLGVDELRWKNPVYAGDTLHMETTVLEKKESSKPGRGVVIMRRDVINQDGALCMTYKANLLMKRDIPAAE